MYRCVEEATFEPESRKTVCDSGGLNELDYQILHRIIFLKYEIGGI
jgi:hypothetical protein